jgi:phosphopantothenoylcysteine decarboxylase/phosphopantothenate--cysteine ligase
VKLQRVTTAREMLAACEAALPADVLVMAAAVADWRPDFAANSKIKKSTEFFRGARGAVDQVGGKPDILATLSAHAARPKLVVGFAAETDDVVANAVAKRTRKGADWIIANDVSANEIGESVMGGERNRVHLISESGVEAWPDMTKNEVGTRLAARIAQKLKGAA